METWQIILAIIIVGLSIIMPIYYSSEKKKKAQQEELEKLRNMVKQLISSLEISINEKTFRDRGSGLNEQNHKIRKI